MELPSAQTVVPPATVPPTDTRSTTMESTFDLIGLQEPSVTTALKYVVWPKLLINKVGATTFVIGRKFRLSGEDSHWITPVNPVNVSSVEFKLEQTVVPPARFTGAVGHCACKSCNDKKLTIKKKRNLMMFK